MTNSTMNNGANNNGAVLNNGVEGEKKMTLVERLRAKNEMMKTMTGKGLTKEQIADDIFGMYNYAEMVSGNFNVAMNGNGKDSISGQVGNATNAFDSIFSIFLGTIFSEGNNEQRVASCIKCLQITYKDMYIVDKENVKYTIGGETSTAKYIPLPRKRNSKGRVIKIRVSESLARRVFIQMFTCKFDTVEDLMLLFEDIDAVARYYQETIIDSVKTNETIELDFLALDQKGLKMKAKHICNSEIKTVFNKETKEFETKHDYDTPSEKSGITVFPTYYSNVQQEMFVSVTECVKEVREKKLTDGRVVTELQGYAGVPLCQELSKVKYLLSQAYTEYAELKGDGEDEQIVAEARRNLDAAKALFAEVLRNYVARNYEDKTDGEKAIITVYMVMAMQQMVGNAKDGYSISEEVMGSGLLDCFEPELLVFALTLNADKDEDAIGKGNVATKYIERYDIIMNDDCRVSDYAGNYAAIKCEKGLAYGIACSELEDVEPGQFIIAGKNDLVDGEKLEGIISEDGKFQVIREVALSYEDTGLYFCRESAFGNIIDADNNIIEIESDEDVLYCTDEDRLSDEYKDVVSCYHYIVRGKAVGTASQEELKASYEEEVEVTEDDFEEFDESELMNC